MPREQPRLEPHKVTLDDIWCDETRTKCAKAMVDWLKGSVNVDRPIRSLKLAEFEAMAEAATSTWIVEASKRVQQKPEPVDVEELRYLLMG